MKYIHSILFLFLSLSYHNGLCKTQRLIIPNSAEIIYLAPEAVTESFCIDPWLEWPMGEIPYIYTGGKESMVTLLIDNISKVMSLEKAKADGYVTTYNMFKLYIVPTNPAHSVKEFKPRNLSVGKEPPHEITPVDPGIFQKLPDDKKIDQPAVYKKITEEDVKKPENVERRVKEFYENHVLKHYNDPEKWETKQERAVIKIHEKKNHSRNPDDAYNLEYIVDELGIEDLDFCIELNPGDSSFSLSISGKYKGMLPVTIQYSSDNQFTATLSYGLPFKDAHGNDAFECSLNVAYSYPENSSDQETNSDSCELSTSLNLCYPPETSSISIEACGTAMNIGLKSISIDKTIKIPGY